MPLPAILYVAIETGLMIKVVGAFRETRKPIIVFDKEMYRDSPPVVTGGAFGAANDASDSSYLSGAIAGGMNPTVTFGVTPATITAVGNASTEEDDSVTHVPKRYIPKLDTLVEFWDADTVGTAGTISVTTTLNSGIITVPDASQLTPGQGIASANFPAGTVVLSIFTQADGVIDATKAVVSQAATIASTVAATLTGSNKVAEVMQSEVLGWGSEISVPL